MEIQLTDNQPVTTVFSQKVKPGREEGFEVWAKGIANAAQQFEGYRGVTILRPQDRVDLEYVIILQFDCYAHLRQWLDSDIRQDWIDRSYPLVEKPQTVQILTGLETWFTLPHQPMQRPPAKYKMAILTTLSVFTLVNVYSSLLSGLLIGLPVLLRSLIVMILVVFSLTYVVMPRLTKLFRVWLFPISKARLKLGVK
jgi:uncharacterized protein